MREKAMSRKRTAILYLSAVGIYWMTISLTMGMAISYLTFRGFSNTEMGSILAAANILSVLISMLLASLSDKYGASGIVPLLVSGLGVSVFALGILLFTPFSKLLFAVAYTLLAASSLAIGPILIKLYFDLSQNTELPSFALFRAFGSLCFAFMSFFAGTILKTKSLTIVPVINSLCVLLQLLCILLLKPDLRSTTNVPKNTPQTGYISLLKSNTSFLYLLGGIFLVFMVHNNISSFNANILDNLGAGATAVAYLNGLTVVAEIPMMALYSRIKGVLPERMLAISFIFFLLKIVLITAATNIGMLFVAFSLQSVSFGLYTPAIVDYVKDSFPYEQAGRAQGVVGNIPTIGSMIGALLFGVMLDNLPLSRSLIIFCFITAAGVISCLYALRKK